MTTALSSQLGSYAQSVARFQAAAAGLYSGPSMPMSLLGDLMSTVDGLDTSSLQEAVVLAAGKHRKGDKGSAFTDFLRDIALGLGGGMVVEFLQSFQLDHDEEADSREELVDDAQRCADAIDDTVSVSGSAIAETLHAAVGIIDALSAVLFRRGHVVMQFLAPALVAIGDRVIEATNSSVAETCRDRDDTIERCYELLERKCECVCQAPEARPAPSVECPPEDAPAAPPPAAACASEPPVACPSGTAGMTQPQSAGSTAGAAPPTAATTPTAPASVTPAPADSGALTAAGASPAPAGKPAVHHEACPARSASCNCTCNCKCETENKKTTPQSAAPESSEPQRSEPAGTHECPGVTADTGCAAGSKEAEDQAVEDAVDHGCSGILGVLGIGVAIVGIGAVAALAMQWLADHADQIEAFLHPETPTPDPMPEPMPGPAPEPVKEEPVKPAAPASDGVITPPEELKKVPEPTPPAQKVEMIQAQNAATNAGSACDPGAAPGDHSSAGASAGSSARTRKAGQW